LTANPVIFLKFCLSMDAMASLAIGAMVQSKESYKTSVPVTTAPNARNRQP
jgi:hypothetical protein